MSGGASVSALAEHVIDRDGMVWRVVRDGGMATRADYTGIVSIGMETLRREHGPLVNIAEQTPRTNSAEALRDLAFDLVNDHRGIPYDVIARIDAIADSLDPDGAAEPRSDAVTAPDEPSRKINLRRWSMSVTRPGEMFTCEVCGDPCRLVHRYPDGLTPPDRTTHSAVIEREARAASVSVPPLDAGRHERACVKVMGEWFDESHERGAFSPIDLSHRIAAAYAAETPRKRATPTRPDPVSTGTPR